MAVRICLVWIQFGSTAGAGTVVTLCGDLNHNELLSAMDVTLALRMAAKHIDIDFAADANSDGAVTVVDTPLIWQSMISKAAPAQHA